MKNTERRLLDPVCKPHMKSHTAEHPQQQQEEEGLCKLEGDSSLDQENSEPPQIKEEPEELHTRQRRGQLDLKQETGLPQQPVCKEEEALSDQQFYNQERTSSLDQDDPEHPQIKEEPEEELCTSKEGEQFGLKEEMEELQLVIVGEESDHADSELESDDQLVSSNSDVAEYRDLQRHLASTMEHNPEETVPNSKSQDPLLFENHCCPLTSKMSFKCGTCGKVFTSKSGLKTHLRVHTEKKTYTCKKCGKIFECQSELKLHLRSHTDEMPHSCKVCGKAFKFNYYLEYHMRTHTGERPYSCDICEKGFFLKSDLNRHFRAHTGEKPFTCQTCDRSFAEKRELKVHLRTHTGERPYSCNTCGQSFSGRTSLTRHLRIHTGEKPFTCTTCGKLFRLKNSLTEHMRSVHDGEKPYCCIICGISFGLRSSLIRHRRIHTGEKPFACDTCGRSFRVNDALKVHMQRVHKGEKT